MLKRPKLGRTACHKIFTGRAWYDVSRAGCGYSTNTGFLSENRYIYPMVHTIEFAVAYPYNRFLLSQPLEVTLNKVRGHRAWRSLLENPEVCG